MKKTIKMKGPEGEIKEFRIDESPLFWKGIGVFMIASGLISIIGIPSEETMFGKLYEAVNGFMMYYLGSHSMTTFTRLREIIIKNWVYLRGYEPIDDESKAYLVDKKII